MSNMIFDRHRKLQETLVFQYNTGLNDGLVGNSIRQGYDHTTAYQFGNRAGAAQKVQMDAVKPLAFKPLDLYKPR